jgi:hypothetical protein
MSQPRIDPPFTSEFLATADAVARDRPGVDLEMAREVFQEAATLLHNGLVLDHLDDHDAAAFVAGLCRDLIAEDPGAAIRAHAEAVIADPGGLHDPAEVSAAYLMTVSLFQL